jgi:uncharacterized short protein YbdD (DUF466 family)
MVCRICDLPSEIGRLKRKLGATARLMVGQPDYAAYAAHVRATHPDEAVMSEAEFFRNREDARYGVGGGARTFRCC